MNRRAIAVLAACVMVVTSGACADRNETRSAEPGTVSAAGITIPNRILGLRVETVDVSKELKDVKRSYVDSLVMFSLREDDLLRATLQVSRLNRLARPKDPNFRRSIISLVGGSTPVELQVDDTQVFTTSGNKQNLFVWFRGRGMFVLSVHQDYAFPRTLLRKVVGLELSQ